MVATKNFLLILILAVAFSEGMAQSEDCELTLGRAVEEFNAGHFYVIPSVLEPCLNQFTREQGQRAYLLLTQTYLLLDDPIGARQSYLKVLDANPEFVPDTALHPIDVIYLSKKFTATSIFSWFAKAGSNVSMPRVIHDLNAFGETGLKEKYFLKIGYQASVGGDLNLTEKINVRAELGYTMASFRHESTQYFNADKKELNERQSWIVVPVTGIYSDNRGKYRPYGYLGYSFHYLLRSRADITLTNDKPRPGSETGERERLTQSSSPIFSQYKKNRFNRSIVVGGGLKAKVGLDFIFLDLRYNLGLKNVTSANDVYADYNREPTSGEFVSSMESSMRFAQVDDFFRLDNFSISVGFLRPLYKPRELRKARTRSVMRQMKN